MVFIISLFLGMMSHHLWQRSDSVAAIDIGVLCSAASLFLQALVGLVVNNFIFLGEKKDWRDFWSDAPFEFLYAGKSMPQDAWRLARGKIIFYFLTIPAVWGVMLLYFYLRA